QHVVHTFQFLTQIPWTKELRRVPEIARSHHEKLDGSGYPYGARAEAIPVQSRMMAIADIYDALTASDRPYKKALRAEEALAILDAERRAGPQPTLGWRPSALHRRTKRQARNVSRRSIAGTRTRWRARGARPWRARARRERRGSARVEWSAAKKGRASAGSRSAGAGAPGT